MRQYNEYANKSLIQDAGENELELLRITVTCIAFFKGLKLHMLYMWDSHIIFKTRKKNVWSVSI